MTDRPRFDLRRDADLHVHTCFSDGKAEPEEYVKAALAGGIKLLGFSDHSYTSIDTSYCMKADMIDVYKAEIRRLKAKYAGHIEILLGIEQDYFSDFPADDFDYRIGSVHYVGKDGEYFAVDSGGSVAGGRERQNKAAERLFGGDIIALCEAYFALVGDVVDRTNADIIGHFDLITKFNEDGTHIDADDPRYEAAAKAAALKLIKTGRPFEINTGAISRGVRLTPYPSAKLRAFIAGNGGRFILSSDAHEPKNLRFGFDSLSPVD